jgi:excisionase family DNA binding protein
MSSTNTDTEHVTERLLTPEEAAEYLNVSLTWLQQKREAGNGPRYIRIGHRTVRYRKCWLSAWVRARSLH